MKLGKMATHSSQTLFRKKIGYLLLACSLAGLLFFTSWFSKDLSKYSELEKNLIEIHAEIEGLIPLERLDISDKFMAGMYIRNTYRLRDENSKLSATFIQVGVSDPDDMSTLVLETFLRSKRSMPFNLKRLIMIQNKVKERLMNNENRNNLYSEMLEEFIVFEKYKEKLPNNLINRTENTSVQNCIEDKGRVGYLYK